jgi:hypothetical protein
MAGEGLGLDEITDRVAVEDDPHSSTRSHLLWNSVKSFVTSSIILAIHQYLNSLIF